ncbi:hypothetical protein [Streptomyces sp. SID12488]|uniref:hypothetical protein n=1 Tax=Streptomyces sp. SID12488 TaxID=2706040 RepID=UPI0013DB1DC0|nr:hypothetical protein [Streptomyces sp. SID12488]NEA64651.1 hypothetical protein [Streptomyces sp. SID12488]
MESASSEANLNITDALTVAGFLVGAIGVPAALMAWRGAARKHTVESFVEVRERARREQAEMTQLAMKSTPPGWRSDPIPMLTLPGWIPPLPLEDVQLDWKGEMRSGDGLPSARYRAMRMMPRNQLGGHYLSYSDALTKLAGMAHLFNGKIYRPIGIKVNRDGFRIECTEGRYFDHLDTSEVLVYEMAARHGKSRTAALSGSYRSWLGNPFDLKLRGMSLGVITLTIRRDNGFSGFYMHQRDGDHVVVGPETIHVVPAGEFTPADVSLESMKNDFDLWRTIMREYAEEFLDLPESYGRGGRPLDYENDHPFNMLNAAKNSGSLNLHILGIGLDPLTWKPEILTACIIEGDTFDRIFAHMARRTREGVILSGLNGKGLRFDAETVELYVNNRNTRSSARACLQLAWRHRNYLGLGQA